MATPLLPTEPAPVTRWDAALTARFLIPAQDALMDFFLALRRDTDQELVQAMALRPGRPYPLGCCQEITLDVLQRLGRRLEKPDHRGARALCAFMDAGGIGRCVWGVLRNRYFQNALQFGGLYVDVANDTVTVTKPKVEILPMAQSGLVAVRGPEHYATIASLYWGLEVYANHALPSLSPILPMIAATPGTVPVLMSATKYMVGMSLRDQFSQTEAWLAQGPAPPLDIMEAIRARCPADLLETNPCATREAAVVACQAARAAGLASNADWCGARLEDYRRIHPNHPNASPALPPALSPPLMIRSKTGRRGQLRK